MSDFLDLPTLIAIGVAIVVLVRLRSVLGTRTGNERPPQGRFSRRKQEPGAEDDNVVQMRPAPADRSPDQQIDTDEDRRARKLEVEVEQFSKGDASVASGLHEIAASDGDFMPKSFMEGAKSAYEMIVTAFAESDRKTLKTLLEKEVYDGFEGVIAEREAHGHKIDFTFVGLPGVHIIDADFDKRTAQITIRFDAEIVSATRDSEGNLVEGNGDEVVNISDEWTFARSTKSRDPNWKLVATNQLD